MIQRFAACIRVVLLRIFGTTADHGMCVVARMNQNLLDQRYIRDLSPHSSCQIDQRLRLILSRMLFRETFQNSTFRFARLG